MMNKAYSVKLIVWSYSWDELAYSLQYLCSITINSFYLNLFGII